MIASLIIPTVAFGAFSDVYSSTDYSNSILWMTDNGVIGGYPDGSFQPNKCVNRVEMLKMLFLASETPLLPGGLAANPFTDTDSTQWYWPYLKTAYQNQVVEGYPDGTFKPSQCVNRVEAIKMAVLEFNNGQMPGAPSGKSVSSKPYDVDSSAWYYNYVMQSVNDDTVGLAHATYHGGGTYKYYPGYSMTRKEVAEMLYRMKAVRDNGAEKYSTAIAPNSIASSFLGNKYSNAQYNLSFDTPTGWSVTAETVVNQELILSLQTEDLDPNQLRLTLSPVQDPSVTITIYTQPVALSYAGYTAEDGFSRNISGLTSHPPSLLRSNETSQLIAINRYYESLTDYASHIEFQFAAPDGNSFDAYLPDYYELLDSVIR